MRSCRQQSRQATRKLLERSPAENENSRFSRSPAMNDLSRRTFLATATAATLTSSASAIGPIARNGEAKFKFSLAAYSYRDFLTAEKDEPAKLTLADFIDDCAKFGLEGTELTSYYFPKAVTPDYLRQLARQCFRLGLDVSGT